MIKDLKMQKSGIMNKKEKMEEEINRNAMLPRRYRKPIGDLVFS